jgi:hypothetical protein
MIQARSGIAPVKGRKDISRKGGDQAFESLARPQAEEAP